MKNIYVVGIKAKGDAPALYIKSTDVEKLCESKLIEKVLNIYDKE